MIGSVDTDTIQEMIPHDDDTRSAQQSEQGHNKEQGAATTEQPVHAAEVTAQSSGNKTDHAKSSQNEGILKLIFVTYLNFACLVTPTNILYTGRMYHVEKKIVGHWITIYSVVRDLEVLKQVRDNKDNIFIF